MAYTWHCFLFDYRLNKEKILFRIKHCNGFTAVELLAALIIFSILSTIAVVGLMQSEEKARHVIVEYDIKKFFEAQNYYSSERGVFQGTIGDIISSDPNVLSTVSLDNYMPSQGTSLTIINENPFTVVGRNGEVKLIYEFNIDTGIISKR